MKSLQESPPIVDRYFIGSLNRLSKQHSGNIRACIFKILVVATILVLHTFYFPPEEPSAKTTFSLLFQLLLALTLGELARLYCFSCAQLNKRQEIIKIATDFRHCLSLEDLHEAGSEQFSQDQLFFQMDSEWGLRVSCTSYNFESMQKVSEVGEEHRQLHENIGQNAIKSAMESQLCCYRMSGFLIEIFAFCLFIFCVVLIIQEPLPSFQGTILQFYIIFQIILKPRISVILVIMVLLPLLLLVAVVYWCCKKEVKVNLPKAREVTKQTLEKCSDCTICFQTFVENEKIIPLSCSDMHIFHETCISAWSKIKPTCPICRSQI